MEHYMGEEKIEQNVERLRNFLFHVLGCGKNDVRRIFDKFTKKYLDEVEKGKIEESMMRKAKKGREIKG